MDDQHLQEFYESLKNEIIRDIQTNNYKNLGNATFCFVCNFLCSVEDTHRVTSVGVSMKVILGRVKH